MVPKIADFGISKFFSDQKHETLATSAVGSLGYMAPEYGTGLTSHLALENWSKRMEAKTTVTDCEQIRICLKIGIQYEEMLQSVNEKLLGGTRKNEEVRETIREDTAEEKMVARVGGMVPAALDAVRAAKVFPERWRAIAGNLEKLRACLVNPCIHGTCQLETNNKAVCGECREKRTIGKQEMQSTIDAVAVKVEVSLRDCELLVKIGDASSSAPVDATSSSCVDVRELQRLLAWLEMSHTEAKNLALERFLEALNKDEKRVVSIFDRDNVSTVVQHLTASWPEGVREKAATVVCHIAGRRKWLLESEVVVPLLISLAESGSLVGRQKAAVALHHLSSTSSSTPRAIFWLGGVPPLIDICRHNHKEGGDNVSQSAAAGTLRNISATAPDLRHLLVADHGIIRVMVGLLHSGDALLESKEHAVECLENFTSCAYDDALWRAVVSEGGQHALLLYLVDNDDRHEVALNAIRNLIRIISTTSGSVGDTMKRLVGEQGCMPLLVRTMQEHNSISAREVAVQMLACLATYPPNAWEMSEDDKCVPALVHLLDPSPNNTKAANKYAVQCLLSLVSTNKRCRNLMISHGANKHLRRLSDLNIAGAADLLCRLEGGWLSSLFSSSKQ
ncbi:hypothetical protein QOZ80_9AG0689560 [Eleusine coracana subsp. coracana]|nr:hypothetical protein QOZ80_9AG0689560 [Eleusine coracana subsp. coracana]